MNLLLRQVSEPRLGVLKGYDCLRRAPLEGKTGEHECAVRNAPAAGPTLPLTGQASAGSHTCPLTTQSQV